MITETMTFSEVYRELDYDRENVKRWMRYRDKEAKRMVLKAQRFPWRKWYDYTSPRKNRYLILLECEDRHYMRNGMVTVLALRRVANGNEAFLTDMEDKQWVTRTVMLPHLVKRYAERTGQQLEGLEALKQLWEHNATGWDSNDARLVGRSVRYNGEDHVAVCVPDGVLLGQQVDGIFVGRTFITYEMATGRQQTEFARLRGNLKPIDSVLRKREARYQQLQQKIAKVKINVKRNNNKP